MKASALIAWCRKHVGDGYVYGTIGEICTQAVLDRCRRMYGAIMGDTYYTVRAVKWRGKWVADCSGLLKAARKALDGVWADVSAQGTYDQCMYVRGPIREMPPKPGTFVFMHGTSAAGVRRMVHVGLYIGDGQVIEARGVDYGIVITRLAERPWTHYGMATHVVFDVPVEDKQTPPAVTAGDSGDASTPKPEDPVQAPAAKPVHPAVLAAHRDGIVGAVEYWDAVLDGAIVPSPTNIEHLIMKYHAALVAERD
jgi:hypothetical protein